MSFQKSQTNLVLLLSFTILGLAYSQISVPLKINNFEQLYFSAVFGNQKCKVDISIIDNYCPNIEILKTPDTVECFSNFTGNNIASFIFGNTLSNLSYTDAIQISQLCIGFSKNQSQINTLSQLVSQKQIHEKRIYFYLFETMGYNGSIGEANIGSPNNNYIKKGTNLVQLKKVGLYDQAYFVFNRDLKFFGKQLDSKNVIFTLNSDHGFTKKAFLQLIQIINQNGISHIFERNEDFQVYKVYFPSIEKLQPIELSLTLEDNTSYPLTLQVSQYTRKLDNGQYQLAIQVLFNSDHMSLSYNIFKTYYVGFDQSNGTVQIAQKGDEDRFLRRAQNNFD